MPEGSSPRGRDGDRYRRGRCRPAAHPPDDLARSCRRACAACCDAPEPPVVVRVYRCPLAPCRGEEKGEARVHCSPTPEAASMALRHRRNPWPEPRRSLHHDGRDDQPRRGGAPRPRRPARLEGRPSRGSASSSAIIAKKTSKADCGATRNTAILASPKPPTEWCGPT